jgi:hypothetical protein
VLAVLFLVNVLNSYDRQALGAVLEPLRREFHLTDARPGALTRIVAACFRSLAPQRTGRSLLPARFSAPL